MRRREVLGGLLGLAGTTVAWSAALPRVLGPPAEVLTTGGPLDPHTRALVERSLDLWGPDLQRRRAALAPLRRANPEWELLARMHTALALASVALRVPAVADRCRQTLDWIAAETLFADTLHGMHHWLLPYGRSRPFRIEPAASLFVDGEIAALLGARLLLGDAPDLEAPFAERIAAIEAQLSEAPAGVAESYPDECWMFCNALALVALRMADALDGERRALPSAWVANARQRFVHTDTGLLISSCTWDGRPLDGPEGSSIWFVARCLQLVAPDFAAEQYWKARGALGRSLSGFGWSREWPAAWRGPQDIDSGAVVPVLDASPGASGHAVGAARAFADDGFAASLYASLELGAFPVEQGGHRRYAASNLVGDAVLLEGLVCGPLWDEINARRTA